MQTPINILMASGLGEDGRFFLGILASAVGFFFALFFNQRVKEAGDKVTAGSMLRAVGEEAASNETVLEKSFKKYIEKDVILRGFSIDIAEKCLAEPMFVRYVKPANVKLIHKYARELRLANAYRQKLEVAWVGKSEGRKLAGLEGMIRDFLKEHLGDCEVCITSVQRLA